MTVSDPEASDIRRVVTGLDGSNKAKVIFDSSLSLASGPYGIKSTNLWITDTCPIRVVAHRRHRIEADRHFPARERHEVSSCRICAAHSGNRGKDGPAISHEGRWARCAGARVAGFSSDDASDSFR